MYPKDIVSGGTGIYYSANNIYIVGRQQEKDGTEVTGYNFIINVEKSRSVKEKCKIAIEVSYEGGISKWSGLMDVALDGGFVTKPSNGWYSKAGSDEKVRMKDTYTKEFWIPILADKTFQEFVEKKYMNSGTSMMSKDVSFEDVDEEYANAEE